MYRQQVKEKKDFLQDLNTEFVIENNFIKEVKITSLKGDTFVIKAGESYNGNVVVFTESKYKKVEKHKVSALLPEGFELVKYFDNDWDAKSFKEKIEGEYSNANVILEKVTVNEE